MLTVLTTTAEAAVPAVPTVLTTTAEAAVPAVLTAHITMAEAAVQVARTAHITTAAADAPLVLHSVRLTVPKIVRETVRDSVEMNVQPVVARYAIIVATTIAAAHAIVLVVEDVVANAKVPAPDYVLKVLIVVVVASAAVAVSVQDHAMDIVTPHVNLPGDSNMEVAQIKKLDNIWQGGVAKSITFIVTKDCQLACKYCYLVGKNSNERMSWPIAKKAVDYILSHESLFPEESVIWDFIGGEPFLEIDLIDKLCDYIKMEMYRLNHHWFNSYRFSFSTNGINYDSPNVQNFIKKNHSHLSIGITIDGTKTKHDLNRIWKQTESDTEKGSYDDVVRNIPLWLSQFPSAPTKVTISSGDIPYICESVIHLFSLGIHEVNINCVFENVWKDGDDLLFENQLIQLADSIIDNKLYESNVCSFFSEHIGKPMDWKDNNNWCGAGKMLSIDAAGNFYPCTRFAAYSLRSKKPIIIGNIHDGIKTNLLRPFLSLDRTTQSPQKCIDCEVATGCAWCQGENYDAADTPTIYQRSTAICKMHKARVRANNYYWNKLFRKLEKEGSREEFESTKPQHTAESC